MRSLPQSIQPTKLALCISGWPPAGPNVFGYENGQLKFQVWCGLWSNTFHGSIVPTAGQWAELWKLCDEIGVWSWPHSLGQRFGGGADGYRWDLEIELGNRRVASSDVGASSDFQDKVRRLHGKLQAMTGWCEVPPEPFVVRDVIYESHCGAIAVFFNDASGHLRKLQLTRLKWSGNLEFDGHGSDRMSPLETAFLDGLRRAQFQLEYRHEIDARKYVDQLITWAESEENMPWSDAYRQRQEEEANARELDRQRVQARERALAARKLAAADQGQYKDGDRCPHCGFGYAWDGSSCDHCGNGASHG